MARRRPRHAASNQDTAGYAADEARQGGIILRRSWQRWVFIGGLVAAVVLMILAQLVG